MISAADPKDLDFIRRILPPTYQPGTRTHYSCYQRKDQYGFSSPLTETMLGRMDPLTNFLPDAFERPHEILKAQDPIAQFAVREQENFE